MIAPLLRSVIAGAVWYQGESDEHSPLAYNCTFPAMIDTWRSEWHNATNGLTDRKFPFGFVQLSVHSGSICYGPKQASCYGMPTWEAGYAAVRYAQTASVGVAPNTVMERVFMATAADIGEQSTPAGGPHVRDKKGVGRRLALAFRDNFIDGDGPFYTPGAVAVAAVLVRTVDETIVLADDDDSATGSSSSLTAGSSLSVRISFRNLPPSAGNDATSSSPPLRPVVSTLGLEVSPDATWDTRRWYNVSREAIGLNGETLLLQVDSGSGSGSGGVGAPAVAVVVRQVRYMWADNCCYGWNSATNQSETDPALVCPLHTSTGLPVLPFILNVTQ